MRQGHLSDARIRKVCLCMQSLRNSTRGLSSTSAIPNGTTMRSTPILTHPKYAGCHVFGRTSGKLYTPIVRLPKSEWVLTPGAFEPIVDPARFRRHREFWKSARSTSRMTNCWTACGLLLASEGRLSLSLIKKSADVPSPSTYRHRFGSLRRAYEQIGYGHPSQFGPIDLRRRTQALREWLVDQITAMFPGEVSIVRRGRRWRSRLRLTRGPVVSLLVARSVRTRENTVRWRVDPVRRERKFLTLLARLDENNRAFLDFHVLPNMDRQKRFDISLSDPWLKRGELFSDLREFCEVVIRARAAMP